jgi:hypothetical protein
MKVKAFGLLGYEQKIEIDQRTGHQDKNRKEKRLPEERNACPSVQNGPGPLPEQGPDLTRDLQRLREGQEVCDYHQVCTPFEVHQAAGSNVAERDHLDTVTKEREAEPLTGNNDVIGTPGVVAALTSINHGALTYPRADAPADVARAGPHQIKEFKAILDEIDECNDSIADAGLQIPRQTTEPQQFKPRAWR